MSDKLKLEIKDENFFKMPDDVLKQFEKYTVTLHAAGALLQKAVQRRIPTEEGLVPRNVVLVKKPRSVKVEVVPIRPRRKKKPIFNPWVNDIEYRKKPFVRPAFDETENDILTMFAMTSGKIT